MKTSRRLLLGTFLALLAAPVVLVAYSRISGGAIRELPPPERTPPAELALLRDFSALDVRGDVSVEVTRASEYAVEFNPIAETRGVFRARVDAGTLVIEAYGNSRETTAATLHIRMPELEQVEAEFLSDLTIRDFDSAELELNLVVIQNVSLENNRIGSLQIQVNQIANLALTGNTIGTSEVRTFGSTITSD